jgi:site-specific recombinase XerD
MKSPDLYKLISDFFVKHLGSEKNVSKHTSLAYRDGIKLLLKFASKEYNCPVRELRIGQFTQPFIVSFIRYLENDRGNTILTQNARLAMVHTFFEYIMIENPSLADQCQRILRIPQKRQIRKSLGYLSADEIKKILDEIDRLNTLGRRDYLLIALIYDTGARVQEVLDLKPCDFRFDSPAHVRILGKGRKERLCPLLPETLRLVIKYVEEYNRSISDSKPLFQGKGREKLSRHGVRYILKKYVKKAGKQMPSLLSRSISPHCLRHSKAVHLLQSGVPLITIKDFLGHADLRTTQIYAETDLEAKRKALQKGGSPVNNDQPKIQDDILDWLENL